MMLWLIFCVLDITLYYNFQLNVYENTSQIIVC